MTELNKMQWNQNEIERHLKSAVGALTSDIFDKIDLSTPQEIYTGPSKVTRLYRRMRTGGLAAAACLCVALLGGGVAGIQNHRVESVIGIDVNPSVELSVNRKEKVLKAEPLNADAEVILDDMDLEDVDLDIAVNALIGSMVRNGYLTELDNAILVTVANDNKEKASVLRQDVVIDIEESLEAHQVEAVVYDQQAPEDDTVRELADRYGISYGKAYFLQELVAENGLTEDDLEVFAGMTMEAIAKEIAERSYVVRAEEEKNPADRDSVSNKAAESLEALMSSETAMNESSESAESVSEDETEKAGGTESESASSSAEGGAAGQTSAAEGGTSGNGGESSGDDEDAGEEGSGGKKVRIDDVDYEAGFLNVVFEEKVKWKNPSVSVQDENGQSYSAMLTDTSSDSCEIYVQGIPGGVECSFTLAGVSVKEGSSYGSVKGYFETPEIAEGAESIFPEGVEPEEWEWDESKLPPPEDDQEDNEHATPSELKKPK